MTVEEENNLKSLNAPRGRKKSAKPKTLSHKEECTNMMNLSRQKVGITGLTIDNIKKWALSDVELTERQILFEREGESAREDAVADILANVLHIFPGEVERNLKEVYITTKGAIIAWIKTDPRMVVELHKRA